MRHKLLIAISALLTLFPSQLLAKPLKSQRELAPDQPGEEEDLNKELWNFVKKTPYESIQPYLYNTQALVKKPQTLTLPNGWKIAPAGEQISLGRLPFEAITYNNNLVVLNNGYYGKDPQEVTIIDPKTSKIIKTLKFPALFPSAVIAQDQDLYISGGYSRKIYRINSQLEPVKEYALNGYAGSIAPIDKNHIAVTYLVSTDSEGKNYTQGKLALLNTQTGNVEKEVSAGNFPYSLRIVNNKLYIAMLGDNKVLVYDRKLNPIKTLPTGKNPQSFCTNGKYLYVVNSSSDNISVIDTQQDKIINTLNLNYKNYQSGSSPTSCTFVQNRLYVTLAQRNGVEILDQTSPLQKAKTLGFIPTGWYPTKVTQNDKQLFILSAKGILPRRPNPNGPQPFAAKGGDQYVLTLLQGSLSIIPKNQINSNLTQWTKQVEQGSPFYNPVQGFKIPIKHIFYIVKENRTYDQILGDLDKGNGDPTLTLFGKAVTPNHHSLAENFVTLDNYYVNGEISVLGHSFTTSGYASPFLQWLANMAYSGRYNAYPFGIVPATFSSNYLWNRLEAKKLSYKIYGEPYYLFTRAYQLIIENYGAESELAKKFYAQSMVLANEVDRGQKFSQQLSSFYGKADTEKMALELLKKPEFKQIVSIVFTGDDSLAKALEKNKKFREQFATFLSHYPFNYHYYDLKYSDIQRYLDWKTEFERQLKTRDVATLHYIWLPNDHTAGEKPDFPNPNQLIAQNDAALGKIIDTISHSLVWQNSLILVTEDDAQNGPDHVDATRTVALVASPYVKRKVVVSDSYDQLSLLRTIEVILGLDPLNLNDGLAVPMYNIFTNKPNNTPYQATPPSQYLMESDQKLLNK